MTGYSGPRVTLEGLISRSTPRCTCLIVFQMCHAAETRTYAETCAYTRSSRTRIGILVSEPPWHPLVVREHIVGKACHLHAVFLLMTKFHEEYMSKRRSRVIMMFPVTFEATVKWTPANSCEADVPIVP